MVALAGSLLWSRIVSNGLIIVDVFAEGEFVWPGSVMGCSPTKSPCGRTRVARVCCGLLTALELSQYRFDYLGLNWTIRVRLRMTRTQLACHEVGRPHCHIVLWCPNPVA